MPTTTELNKFDATLGYDNNKDIWNLAQLKILLLLPPLANFCSIVNVCKMLNQEIFHKMGHEVHKSHAKQRKEWTNKIINLL